jgi:ubiquinone/menaquinone biosynthesis C-methylase UbiE
MNPAPPLSSTRPTAPHPDIIAAVSATPVAGNVYDKYASANPVVRRLMASFYAALDGLVADAAPESVLDPGCGEGIVTRRMARATSGRVTGLDVESPRLRAAWAAADERVDYVVGDARALAFGGDEFDLVSLVEMLQLVEDPGRAVPARRDDVRDERALASWRRRAWRGPP